jgi:hypothetical protein
MNKGDKKQDKLIKDPRQAARALEVLLATSYLDKKRLYLENFLRGLTFGAGSVLGATVLVVMILWLLSLFEEIPLIGPVADKFTDSLENR